MRQEPDSWFQERTGAYLLRQERAALAQTLPTVFGFYLVQAGHWGADGALLETSAIRTRFVVSERGGGGAQLLGHAARLPFAADSVDAVLLPHTLERCGDPHRVLREAERVLTGEGHLIVLGFHPWSLWGWRARFGRHAPWAGRFVRARRLQEWLTVLGFETLRVQHYLFRPPFRRTLLVRSAFLDRLRWRLTSGAYMLVAKKQVFGVTPVRLKQALPKRTFAGVAKPTTRGMS